MSELILTTRLALISQQLLLGLNDITSAIIACDNQDHTWTSDAEVESEVRLLLNRLEMRLTRAAVASRHAIGDEDSRRRAT
jgi:hypothetical protein